jgi:hypothetical protein
VASAAGLTPLLFPGLFFMDITKLSESELQIKLFSYLGKWFDVSIETRSDCGKWRVDILAHHHTDKDRLYPIVIELKKNDQKTGTEIGEWCLQAGNYANSFFDGRKPMVFTYPQLSGFYLEEGKFVCKHNIEASGDLGQQHNMNPFLYRSFGIGELQVFNCRWPFKGKAVRLVINTYRIWTSNQPYEFNIHKIPKRLINGPATFC